LNLRYRLMSRLHADHEESDDLGRLDRDLAGSVPLCVPFGDPDATFLLARRRALQPDYFVGLIRVFTHDDIARKIASLERCQGLVARLAQMEVPPSPQVESRAADLRSFFQHLFLYPFPVPIDRRQLDTDIADPVRAYCMRHFQLRKKLAADLGLYLRT